MHLAEARRTTTLNQAETPYLDALVAHREHLAACFNVPAHKAGRYAAPKLREAIGELALAFDTEPMIPGIDSGPRPTPLDLSQGLAADAWGASRSWFIDRGGSGAVHVAVLAARQLGPKILMQRNVHSSAIEGLTLFGLQPAFVQPDVDLQLGVAHCVSREALKAALAEHPDVGAVFLLSPTYFGAAADVAGLVEEAHARGIPVIVDEAWGAHFAFSDRVPRDAISAGADLVVSSTHKMAGSLTQSAMIHLGADPLGFEGAVVDRAVTALESTSPSALLAGSLDAARSWMATEGERAIAATLDDVPGIHAELRDRLGLEVLDRRAVGSYSIDDVDLMRLCIDTRPGGVDARPLGDALRAQGVFPELVGDNVVVAILAPGEEREHMELLIAALERALAGEAGEARLSAHRLPLPADGPRVMSPRDAWLSARERIPLRQAVGRVAADALAVYPPGIPNVVPGEAITAELVEFLEESMAAGAFVRGGTDRTLQTMSVVATPSS
jgi:lysine decarboxylase